MKKKMLAAVLLWGLATGTASAAAAVTDAEEKETADIFVAYAVYRLQGCQSRDCMMKVLIMRASGLRGGNIPKKYRDKEPTRCQLKNIDDECEVYAYSSDGGLRQEKDLFISERRVTYSADVKINRPGKCVVMLLSSYSPVIWNIYTTPPTDLRAVLAGGHYKQIIRGMKAGVQTKNRNDNHMNDSNDRCLNYHFGKDEIAQAVEELNIGLKNVRVLTQPVVGEKISLTENIMVDFLSNRRIIFTMNNF